jgi:hypothetical protein
MTPISTFEAMVCELRGNFWSSTTHKLPCKRRLEGLISTFPGRVDHKLLQRLQLLSATPMTIRPHSVPSVADGEFEADAEESTPVMTPYINRVWKDSRGVRGMILAVG